MNKQPPSTGCILGQAPEPCFQIEQYVCSEHAILYMIWSQKSACGLVAGKKPSGTRGKVIYFHDGGCELLGPGDMREESRIGLGKLEIPSNSRSLFKELRTGCEPLILALRSLGPETPEFKPTRPN